MRQAEKRILDKIIGEGQYDFRIRPSGVNQTLTKGEKEKKNHLFFSLKSITKIRVIDFVDGPANVTINMLVRSISSIDDVTMASVVFFPKVYKKTTTTRTTTASFLTGA